MLYFILIARSDCMELNIDNINVHDAYKIAKDILNQENKKYGLNLSVNLLGFKSYYTSDLFNKKFKLSKGKYKFRTLLLPFKVLGQHGSVQQDNHREKEYVLVFSDSCILNSLFSGKGMLSDLLVTCYHEITHAKQEVTRSHKYGYRYFESVAIFHMEDAIMGYDYDFYQEYHDSFYKEIDANLKGNMMSIQYLNTNYPNSYQNDKEILYQNSILHEYQLKNYDFNFFLEKIYDIYSENPKKFYGIAPDFVPIPTSFCLPCSTQFKSVKEIMNEYNDWITPHKDFFGNEVQITDEKEKDFFELFAAFLTSDLYLSQLNLNDLDDEEKKFLDLACLYSINKERDREKFNNSVKNLPSISADELRSNMEDNQQKLKILQDIVKYLDVNSLDDKSTRKGTLR